MVNGPSNNRVNATVRPVKPRLHSIVGTLFGLVGVISVMADDAQEKRTLLAAFESMEVETQKLAMTQLRTLGIACEVYTTVHKAPYPAGKFGPVAQLTDAFVPEFLPEPIVEGPWGETIYYWSDGLGYFIIGPGRDGKLDYDYATLIGNAIPNGWDELETKICAGARDDLDADLIWWNGTFCAWFKRHDNGPGR